MIATMTKEVPKTAVSAITPMFTQLCNSASVSHKTTTQIRPSSPASFDWALHPGGASILLGAKQALQLTDDHIRASLATYSAYGNSSSPTVLIVLDRLRQMGKGRDDIVATSFGPGMMIEMCLLKKCRDVERISPLSPRVGKNYRLWMSLQSRLSRMVRWPSMAHRQSGLKHEDDSIVS
jgi:type III polyketide synthase